MTVPRRRRRWRVTPCAPPLCIAWLLGLAAAVLRLALALRPAELFHARPFIEDAWYALTVARSLGRGTGLSVDGVTPTNGVQPLIVVLYAPLYALFPDAVAERFAFLLCVAIEFALAVLLARTVRSMSRDAERGRFAAAIAFALPLWSFSAMVYTLNGLETGLAVALVLAATARWLRDAERHPSAVRPALAAGALMGLAVLARIDAALLVPILLAWRLSHDGRTRTLAGWSSRLPAVLAAGAAAVAVSLPWWMYNLVTFGHLTPTSGLSQRMVIPFAENLTALLQAVANATLLIGHVPYRPDPHPALLGWSVVLAAAAIAAAALPSLRELTRRAILRLRAKWQWMPLLPILLFEGVLAAYYVLDFGAPHFLQRYLFGIRVLAMGAAAVIAAEGWMWWRARAGTSATGRPSIRRRLAVLAVITLPIGVPSIPLSWQFSPARAAENDFLAISRWIGAHTRPDERIGMGQSGTAGYFNRTVTNLDGKVNSRVFEAAARGSFCAWVDSARFEYLIDREHFFTRLEPCDVLRAYAPVDTVGRFLIYRRIDP